MAIPNRFVIDMFVKVSNDRNLKPEVRAWFILFSLKDPQMNSFRLQIRDPSEPSEMDKFLMSRGVVDINNVYSYPCVNCNRPVTGLVYNVLGVCYNCNNNMCRVDHRDKPLFWTLNYGPAESAPCKCCGSTIHRNNFEAAHVIAKCFGGAATPHNIVPTCSSCNATMGTTNLHVYAEELERIRQLLQAWPYFEATMAARWQALVCAWNPTLSG